MEYKRSELNSEKLRSRAEDLLKNGEGSSSVSTEEECKDNLSLIHELQVHQIELEMQNEDLKRAKLEAEDAIARYSGLYDFAPIGLFTLDMQGAIKEANQAGAVLLGQRRQNILRSNFLLFVAPEDRVSFNGFLKKTLQASSRQTCELSLARDEGSPIYAHIVGTATKDSQHDGHQCLIAVTDITERMEMELELRAARDDLELRVADRTAELSAAKKDLEAANMDLQAELAHHQSLEAGLVIANNQALEAVEAKAAFMANMSHELRTPLNAIIGFSSLLLDEPLTPEQNDSIERIRNGGEALLALINDILDFSKIEKNKVELCCQPLSLRALVEESLSMVAPAAKDKGLNLSYIISQGTPDNIIGDQGRLRQIMANLLSNAVKFTDSGDVSMSVSSKALGKKRHQILFAVRDTGIGIPQDKMDMLFLPFSQIERSLSLKREGTGLGLVISKSLAELMGGKIWAESEYGKGSIFSFTIDAEVAPGCDTGRPAKTACENLAEKNPLRILVAEDIPSNQKVIVEMLRRMGYRADMAANGREVLEALERQKYDLVLMDIAMPEMDGLEAARQIRKRWPVWPKIIAITAVAMEGDREKCIEAGMDDYIAKPVRKEHLAMLLRNITPPKDKI